MAFVKPSINKIQADIAQLSIYLRSTKKFGKTTLFRDLILAKYGDPSYGLLVGCGAEIGYKMLDNLNTTQVSSWKDLIELKKWLIEGKGTEHNIKIIAFDTGDQLVLLADKETIRQSNIENPNKPTKSIKGAFSGFTAGEKYSANNLITPYLTELQLNGFGTWVIAHSKFKTIRDKGSLDEDGYQQLTSNLGADYEAAFGDCMDVCLTGVIDRDFDEKGEGDKKKRYATETVRKLYFRGTPMIDAGGRFADGAVPEYMVFDKPNMGAEFLKIVEEGMEKSKTDFTVKKVTTPKKSTKKSPVKEEDDELMEQLRAVVEQVEANDKAEDDEPLFDIDSEMDIFEEETVEEDEVITLDDTRLNSIRDKFRGSTAQVKSEVKKHLAGYGGKLVAEMKQSDVNAIEEILGLNDEV